VEVVEEEEVEVANFAADAWHLVKLAANLIKDYQEGVDEGVKGLDWNYCYLKN
jgi:hypothetical protein